ncbi:hypothetical protein Tco_0782894 [Tanacetum coccineum]
MHGLMEDARDTIGLKTERPSQPLYRDRPIHPSSSILWSRGRGLEGPRGWDFSRRKLDHPETSSVDYGTTAAKGATDTDG